MFNGYKKLILFIVILINSITYANESILQNSQQVNPSSPCVIVIFGATGDLTARKLLPAIYHLSKEGHLSEHTAVVGVGRGDYQDSSFRKHIYDNLTNFSRTQPIQPDDWSTFEKKLFYHRANFSDDEGYASLQKLLIKLDDELGTNGNRIYYFATQPSNFPIILEKLSSHHLIANVQDAKNWTHVIIEKPFGYDLESAVELQKVITKYLDESQIFRIDHYLGKEGVQNLLALRFENGLFEPLWNNQYIDNIQITLSEEIGVGGRGRFWEEIGYLRDIFQNHLMQLLEIVAMEPPTDLTPECIHAEKIKVLHAVRPILSDVDRYIIRGQYGSGKIHHDDVRGYRQESDVSTTSNVETFVAAKMFIDNPRWQGVPFYIRGGKRLPYQTTEVVVNFKPHFLANKHRNTLIIRIQPKAGIFLQTASKMPGMNHSMQPVAFGYTQDSSFKTSSPEAYEKLLYDCILGDHSLFVTIEEQLAAWHLLTPVIKHWESAPLEIFPNYEAGSWGPQSANHLLNQNGHQWQQN